MSAAQPPAAGQHPKLSASATVDVVHEIATLLGTGLDRRSVQVLMALIDSGVNPEALAGVVQEVRAAAAAAAAGAGATGGAGNSATAGTRA